MSNKESIRETLTEMHALRAAYQKLETELIRQGVQGNFLLSVAGESLASVGQNGVTFGGCEILLPPRAEPTPPREAPIVPYSGDEEVAKQDAE